MMKTTALITTALSAVLLIGGALPSSAGPSTRSVTRDYAFPSGLVLLVSEVHWFLPVGEYQHFRAGAGERKVVFSVEDESGMPARGHVHADLDDDGDLDVVADFCSESDPIKIRPGQRLEVGVLAGECPDGSPSVATEGTITATFSS